MRWLPGRRNPSLASGDGSPQDRPGLRPVSLRSPFAEQCFRSLSIAWVCDTLTAHFTPAVIIAARYYGE